MKQPSMHAPEQNSPLRPIRITHLITGLQTGGAEMMLYKTLSRLDRTRFEPEVISMLTPGPMAEKIAALGISVRSLEMTRGIPSPQAVARLGWMLVQRRPDILQTWLYHADLLGALVAPLARVPILCWNIRNSTLEPGKSKPMTMAVVRVCAKLSHRLPKAIICCSHVAQDLHIRWGYDEHRMRVIPNGFDLDAFQPDEKARAEVRRELDIPPDALVVGLVGRFDPQKDHAGFIEAAVLLSRSIAGVYFVMVGDQVTWDTPALKDPITASGLAPRFRLLGRRADIPRVTASFDVAASASAFGEAFSNVLGEAMACAVPCVTTDVGDAALIVGDTGQVVPPRLPVALAHGLEKMLRMTPEARAALGQSARKRVAEQFSLTDITHRYETLYSELAASCVD